MSNTCRFQDLWQREAGGGGGGPPGAGRRYARACRVSFPPVPRHPALLVSLAFFFISLPGAGQGEGGGVLWVYSPFAPR